MNKAIDEAIRVTKSGGVIPFRFILVYAIMYANYLQGNWAAARVREENFQMTTLIWHFKDSCSPDTMIEFEKLFEKKPVEMDTTG